MANGDLAAARGWTTNAGADDRRMGWDRINYALDRAAEQAKRLDVVEAVISQPIFKAGRSTNAVNLNDNTTYQAASNWYAAPVVNEGFTKWQAGQLTVAKAGLYRLTVHAQFVGIRDTVEALVARNTAATPAPAGNTLVKNSNAGRATTATDLVRLAAGDVLTVQVMCVGAGAANLLGTNAYDFTFSAEWVRA
ncbi:hypothetical protein [Curtobacterium flaccumfaciens]|uniref:hypothetical protein n=1 Tax=Curtobacterium flaccumfaciens TaxID=2035 RepID=UPI001BDF2C0F|nr:hypothetical protein [Curtobacterium flaccumfaciens]MBT1633759.1 hypothetical protein [Curtobacterium flaccumfaciens pv. oortii]MCX2845563.1 hypothetical protein [Curtobacterium flaccumfaciens pv. oortii]